jgi:RNA polymerase sigma factor (sigma-70 family)
LESGNGESVEALLQRLRSGDASAAWRSFLAQYGALLLSVISVHAHDDDSRNDLFLHVCEALCEDRFARLNKFDARGRARFTTWLRVVATNLCIDWIRTQKGRIRPFASIAKLPALERALFHLRFDRQLERPACFAALRIDFPDLGEERFLTALRNVERELSAEQRWRASLRGRTHIPLEQASEVPTNDDAEATAADQEAAQRLTLALGELDPRDRLLLAYRFEQDLTFDQIARLMDLGDAFRARRHVQAALDRLSAVFEKK